MGPKKNKRKNIGNKCIYMKRKKQRKEKHDRNNT